eukprot:scaffold1401_cov330-Pavlova_lutheri.AAC.138
MKKPTRFENGERVNKTRVQERERLLYVGEGERTFDVIRPTTQAATQLRFGKGTLFTCPDPL